MRKPKISNAELRKAAAQVHNAMLAQIPETDNNLFSLDPEFCQQMEKKEKRIRAVRRFRKQVAAAVAALVVGFGCLLAFNSEVRAATAAWFRELYETYIIYRFPGEQPAVFPDCELTWLPEGMELVQEESMDDTSKTRVYLDSLYPDKGFVIDWRMQGTGDWEIYLDKEGNVTRRVQINEYSGELILPNEENENICLVWFDTDHHVLFLINGNLNADVILHIAEGVALAEPTK